MQKLTFTSPSGLGEYQINEPTRAQLKEVIFHLRSHWSRQTPQSGLALADLTLKISGVDVSGLCELDEILLCDEIALFYFDKASADTKKKPASDSGSGAGS